MNSPLAELNAHTIKCELAGEVLLSSGRLRLQVMGWSMVPAIWPGDMLVIESVKADDVSKGDIVLFGRDRRLFTHRVVTTGGCSQNAEVLTRGDAMPSADRPVADHELLGRVTSIWRNGKRLEPRKTPGVSERAVAAVVRNSEIAARIVAGIHQMRQTSKDPTLSVDASATQTSLIQSS